MGGVLLGVRGRDRFNSPNVRRLFYALIHKIQSYPLQSLYDVTPNQLLTVTEPIPEPTTLLLLAGPAALALRRRRT